MQHRPQSRSAYVEMLQTISEYISQMCANPAEKGHGYTLYGTIQSMFLMVLRALYHSPDEASCLNDANRILDFYVDFLNDAMRLYEYLPEYVLGEHLSLLKDKLGFDHGNSLAPKPPVPRVPPPPQGTPERSCFKKRYS